MRSLTLPLAPAASFRTRVYDLLNPGDDGGRLDRVVDAALVTLITLNIAGMVLETVEPVAERYAGLFSGFWAASVAVFTAEYLLRLWSAPADPRYAGGALRGRLRYARSRLAVIDLLAILPAYLPLLSVDLRVLRAARLLRILRLAKLARYSRALDTFGAVLRARRDELVTALLLLFLLLLLASWLLYFAEHAAQPEEFGSIPATMWWAVATLTTVGYGDVYPVTAAGRVLASIVAILGIGTFALPTGILGAAFVEVMERRKEPLRVICPHCGRDTADLAHQPAGASRGAAPDTG